MGVRAARIVDRFDIPAAEVTTVPAAPSGVEGDDAGFGYVLSHSYSLSALATNRLLAKGARVQWASESFDHWPLGTLIIRNADEARRAIRAPTIGLYRNHRANMAEAWTRWLFDQYEFSHENLYDADIRKGEPGRFDVILPIRRRATS